MQLPALKTLFRRIDPLIAIGQGIVVLIAFIAGGTITSHFHEATASTGAMLAAISGVVVLLGHARDAVHQGWWRVLGTLPGVLPGVLLAFAYLSFLPYSMAGMVSMVVALITLFMMLSIPDNGKIATVTLIFMVVAAKNNPDVPAWTNGLLQFTEATVGVLTGIAVAWLSEKIRTAPKNPQNPPGTGTESGSGTGAGTRDQSL